MSRENVSVTKKRKKPKHRFNWRPDLPDFRDYTFTEKVTAPLSVPTRVDLRSQCSPVVNQGQIGSCTGNALAGALEFLELAELKKKGVDLFEFGKKFETISRLFIYYNERTLEGNVDSDSGGTLRDGIKTLVASGACREATWKYTTTNVFKKPSTKAYAEARKHKMTSYLSLVSLQQMKECLVSGFPFVFGFQVFESFETRDVASTGRMPLPRSTERALGGHAVLGVGYDDTERVLIVRNSWGPEWGIDGYFLMPYAYVDELNLARDFWTLRR